MGRCEIMPSALIFHGIALHSFAKHAFRWLHSPKAKEELDRLCDEARNPSSRHGPEAALTYRKFCGDAAHGQRNSFTTARPSRTGRRGG